MSAAESIRPIRAQVARIVDRGWRPFPCKYGEKRPAVGIHWPTATASAQNVKTLDHWFGGQPVNIGIACRGSNLVILDEDELGGMERLCAAYGQPIPVTYRVKTAKGWHWYFDAPDWCEIGNSPGPLEDFGFDVRGTKGGAEKAGGYVIGPGSMHKSGHVYAAEDADADTVELPVWIAELLLTEREDDNGDRIEDSRPPTSSDRRFTKAQARDYIERYAAGPLREAREGRRNKALNDAAMLIGHFVPALFADSVARRRLMEMGREIGLDAAEIGPTVRSGLRAGMREPYTIVADFSDEDQGGGDEDEGLTAAERVRKAKVDEALERLEVADEARRLFNARHQPRAEAPAPMSLTELLALPDEAIRYRVDGLLGVGGRILLAAAQKAGKTTLMGNLVRCLLDGGEFLGRHHVEPVKGRVVLLDTELPTRTLKDWLARQGIANQDGLEIFSLRDRVTSFNLTDPAVLAEWVQILTPLEVGFVVLDCLRPVLDGAGLDESKEAGRFLVPFGELLGRIGVQEACLVQHMGHTGERARGDSGLLGWADANWKIVRKDSEDDHSTRFFSAFGRDVDVPECELGWNSMTNELRAIGGNRKESMARAALPAILEAIGTGKLSGRQIEAELAESDFTRAVIREALKLAIREGRVAVEDGPKASKLHSIRASAPSAP